MKLEHAAVKTNDLNASVNFWTKILGLSVKEKRYIKAHETTLVFLKDNDTGFELELIYDERSCKKSQNLDSAFAHFAFLTDDINRDFSRMKKNGVVFKREPFYSLDKSMKLAFLTDPNGITIEIIQYLNI